MAHTHGTGEAMGVQGCPRGGQQAARKPAAALALACAPSTPPLRLHVSKP